MFFTPGQTHVRKTENLVFTIRVLYAILRLNAALCIRQIVVCLSDFISLFSMHRVHSTQVQVDRFQCILYILTKSKCLLKATAPVFSNAKWQWKHSYKNIQIYL